MSVIINEFEVVIDPPAGRELPPNLQPAEQQPPAAQKLTPMDMREVLRQQIERMLRTWAC